jgi:DNA-3-methyladenine glycosylase
VASALGIDTAFSGRPLFQQGGLEVHDAAAPRELLVGPRVGVGYADADHQNAPWRIAAAGTPWVSERRTLLPLTGSVASFLRRQRPAGI